MIKNVVFDLGKVLLNFEPLDHLRARIADEAAVKELYELIFLSEEWLLLDRGSISDAEALAAWCGRKPQYEGLIRYSMEQWYEMMTPITETVELLKAAKAAGRNVFVLSNFHHSARDAVCAEYDFFTLLDGAVFSCDCHLLKPEAEIYRLLLQKYELEAKQTLFIDDVKDNVEAAARQDIQAIHFCGAADLRERFLQLKVI